MTPETIGRYEIQSEIGRGGMATVYLAYDPNFRRKVAIKLVSVNLQENPVFRARFEREAHLIARIEHPAIVPVYDFGEQQQQPYLVMRYMAGGSLSGKIAGKIMPLDEAIRIIEQIAPALDAVHAQGVVHRDLKPGNILFDDFGNAAIADFGIAHLSEATVDLTGSALIGTPAYMSPEQVRGESELDGRSDIYALGVILFEMLTGQGPFRATTPMSVALKHLTEPIPSILTLRPELPFEVELVLNKALAKDRDMRYASASEMVSGLRDISIPTTPLIQPPAADATPQPPPPSPVSQAAPGAPRATAKPPKRAQSGAGSFIKVASITGISLMLLLFCGLGLLAIVWFGLSTPSGPPPVPTEPVAQPAFTTVPLPTPEPPPTDSAEILFADNFLDDQTLWPVVEDEGGRYAYEADGYHIFVADYDSAFWVRTDEAFDDASFYVDARPVTRTDGYYGLICRASEQNDYYYFIIRSNGSYVIGKYQSGQFQNLLGDDWLSSAAIQPGVQPNRLRADCAGDTLRFYANDILLAEVSDRSFTFGNGGLVVAALDEQGFEVIFNNFLVTRPAQ